MKIGSDGSLPRITSSAKDLRNNFRIIKVPNSVPSYKLVVIRPTIHHEELSEKSSDAELSDDDLVDVKFPSKSTEKEKVLNTKTDHHDKQNEANNGGVVRERNHYNRNRQYHNKNNRYYGQRNNTFNKISKHYKSLSNTRGTYNYGNRDLNPSTSRDFKPAGNRNLSSTAGGRDFNSAASGRDFNSSPSGRDFNSAPSGRDFNSAPGGRDINSAASGRDINSAAGGRDINSAASGRDINSVASGLDINSAAGCREINSNSAGGRDCNIADFTSTPNQDFNFTADHHVPYNSDKYQHSSDFPISPWLDFPPILPQYSHTPFPLVPLPGNPRHPLGLLGDRPLDTHSLPMFQSNNPTNNFVCDQTAPYPSMTSNFSPNNHNSFVHNSSYSQNTSNYPSSKNTDNFITDKNYRNGNRYGNYRNNNQFRKQYLNNDNKRNRNAWNKGPRQHPNERNNPPRNNKRFDYRK